MAFRDRRPLAQVYLCASSGSRCRDRIRSFVVARDSALRVQQRRPRSGRRHARRVLQCPAPTRRKNNLRGQGRGVGRTRLILYTLNRDDRLHQVCGAGGKDAKPYPSTPESLRDRTTATAPHHSTSVSLRDRPAMRCRNTGFWVATHPPSHPQPPKTPPNRAQQVHRTARPVTMQRPWQCIACHCCTVVS
jgi:hypothetical protein